MTSIMSSSPQNMSPPGLAPLGHHSHTSVSSVSDQSPSSQSTATPSADLPANLEFAPVCMYRGDCQTGSQLRKAISHIFGRNKLCTRMIPTGVWVHYCRKHYQRTRYRNGGEYPQRQIGLVQEQVRRVQAWSDSNVQQNRGPVLKDWSLSVRKREQLRLDSKVQASAGKKRPFHDDGMEDEDLDNFDDRAEMSGTAVPAWVVEQIGDGYSTPSILAIVERLKNDIDQGRLQQIPDIEILPNIVTDSSNDEPASNNTVKKTYTKRRTAVSSGLGVANAHRRSQSVNTSALRYDSAPMVRRSSQPNNYMDPSSRSFAADYLQLPMEKRQRVDGESIGMGHRHHQHHHSMSGILDRYEPLMAHRPGFNGRVQLAHRPAFAGIRESHAEGQAGYYPEEQRYGGGPSGAGDVYAHQNGYVADRRYSGVGGPDPQMPALGFDPLRDHERHHSTSGSGPSETGYGVLPAPNPQRFGGPSVAQQLESSSYVLNSAANRRAGVHQRSQSEAGFFHHMSSSQYGRPTSSGSHTQPQLSNLPRLSTNFTEEEPRTGYPPYQHHRAQNSQSSHLTAHRAPGHGHSQSMGHAHHYSHSGNLQDHNGSYYNQYNAPGRYTEDERRNSLNNEQPQPPAFGPSAAGSSNGNFDKFENVQLPPLQNVVQPAPPLLQSTVPHASALDSSAAAQPTTAEGADRLMPPSASHYPGHSRHQSSSSVAHVLSPSTETNNMSSYTAVPAHATAPQPLDAC
ncbi:hypothetical protein SEUCBS139899_005285 [Sporothrix eucalyptigena]|uniref:ORP1 like protein n=1 Tax=Sporothrix eucalyptigena TaxID=1812306 RepID=A0ABP0BS93_9PEZI